MTENSKFPRLVGLACHDLRTPLATVYGFARTLERLDLPPPAARYVEMIVGAAEQMTGLLDELALVARIESGRYEPAVSPVDTLELARSAAGEEEGVAVEGEGAVVNVDVEVARRALARLARATRRHGGVETVELAVSGPVLELAPVTETAAPVVTGQELQELGAAVAVAAVEALGGSLELDEDRLKIRLPQ